MNFTAPESLIFWTTLIFVIFFILLKKFAWKPILGAVKTREESINNALKAAETARQEMVALQSKNEEALQLARQERDAMMKEAREIKEKMIADAKAEASAESAKLIEQAKAAINAEKNAAMADIKAQVSSLSLEIAEKLLKDELSNKDSQMKLVDKLLADAKLN
ncbi:F0F1 ATP synthase subunit B [Flavobacterium sp.]|uniref:F0F1 ATP synthase subunit B n=1 Tax=Flavobacterium sp. TaxID=239 RepID=UPI001228BAB8|nr:F0F1 ATP synthase subunit B [Flavobacterium sp.]RZJ71998.1 MAG: F0F1 ATP synthase subunit B [Flavobacterium sp.]